MYHIQSPIMGVELASGQAGFNLCILVLQRRLGGIEEDGILDRPALGVRLLGRRIARLGVMQPAQ